MFLKILILDFNMNYEISNNDKVLLLRCQNNIMELQQELDKINQEKLLLKEKNDFLQKNLYHFENKLKEEQSAKEKTQGHKFR